jgi:hypothetical protein
MNPSGMRMEEKQQLQQRQQAKQLHQQRGNKCNGTIWKSVRRIRTNPRSSRSVLERAREYNRRIEDVSGNSRSRVWNVGWWSWWWHG